jgi:hypothetical protein
MSPTVQPSRDEDVGTLDCFLTNACIYDKTTLFSGSAMNLEELGRHENLNTFRGKNPLRFLYDIRIFPLHQPRPVLDDCHVAAEPTVRLGQFETHVPSSP